MSSSIDSQNYVIVEEVMSDGDIPVTIYVNKITGLRVVTAYVECPIVKGDLVFATEAHDDDGLPHTLEHLVFLGSEDYPYKGFLDLIANRCLADGTNACTDTDNTNYTVSTAGSDGFLTLLPIYLDHLLFPTLTDSAYTTEVHHIDEKGEDAGVVYCEMQARENTGDSRCHLELLRSMYPGKCGYKSETGGLMENLRTSTNNVKVREYHKAFYHAKNLCVIVTGPVDARDIFKVIKPIEDKIVRKGLNSIDFERPWMTPVSPLDNSVERKIQYPSDTDEDGLVYIGFRGPYVDDNYEEYTAIFILLDYLNSTAISPIQRDFIECDEPYCSSVSHYVIENSTCCFYLTFESVGKPFLDQVSNKLFDLLRNISERREKFDMERMQTILRRKIVSFLSVAETSPHAVVIGPIVGHFLYSKHDLKIRCNEISILEKLLELNEDYWLTLIDKYLIGKDARHVTIVGEPSPTLMHSMVEAEKARLAKQKESLKDELQTIGKKLRSCIEANDVQAPPSLLNSVEVPSADNIKFHPIERVVLDTSLTPFRFQYDSIKTNFITIQLLLDTSHTLSKIDRLYLPLMSELIMECPIERDGVIVPYEKIVAELFSDTIAYGSSIGMSSSTFSAGLMSMLFIVQLQVEMSKYEKAVNWFRELLYKTVFTPERIKTVATRMVSDITQYKRSGSKVVQAASNGITYNTNSNQWATNFMRQQKFLKQLLKTLKSEPKTVQRNMTKIRDSLTRPNNMLLHMAINKHKFDISKVHEPWLKLIPEKILNDSPCEHLQLSKITPCFKLVEPIPEPKAAIVGVGSIESNFLHLLVKSINSLTHPDLAAVYVLLKYLDQLEGPLCRQIRGHGLSYSYSLFISPSDGLLHFSLLRSTQLAAAYNKAYEIVERLLNGEDELEDSLIESAKSILIFEFIRREKSAAAKSMQSLVAHIRDLDIDFNKDLIKRVARVTKDDLLRVAPIYLRQLFKDPERLVAVCCPSSKLEEVRTGLAASDLELSRINLEEEKFLNSIE